MQRLLLQLEQRSYQFISLTDFVPFVPAKSVRLQVASESSVQLADVTGGGQPDVVQWDGEKGELRVQRGRFTGFRNEPIGEAAVWARIPLKSGEVWTMLDDNGDGRSDLWVMRLDGTLNAYRAGDGTFTLTRTWKVSTTGWSELYALNEGEAGWVLAGRTADRTHLEAIALQGDSYRPLAPLPLERKLAQLVTGDLDGDGREELVVPFTRSSRWLQLSPNLTTGKWEKNAPTLELPSGVDGQVRVADYNGDGMQDVLFWNRAQQSFTVYLQTATNKFEYLSQMGPWGPMNGKLIVTDLNGDGCKDIAVVNGEEPYVDTAISWESRDIRPIDR
ncbi:FG-GAP repeat domain-containing protein [Paenibacillus sp. MBLB4367]|uniref:FG-GAP repeat domain-containing protein n=1 Tax=Paenibacillus sp. MBLB4367 TaxID=3384767 RepID=UPI0039080D33